MSGSGNEMGEGAPRDIGHVGSDDFMPSQTGFLISAICRQERAFSWDAMIEEQLHADSSTITSQQAKLPGTGNLMLPDDSIGDGYARKKAISISTSGISNGKTKKMTALTNQQFPEPMTDVFNSNMPRAHHYIQNQHPFSNRTSTRGQEDDILNQLQDIFANEHPDSGAMHNKSAAGVSAGRSVYSHSHDRMAWKSQADTSYADLKASNGSNVGGPGADASSSSAAAAPVKRIGIYTLEERALKIKLFREKKEKQVWCKAVKYDCRKKLADTRPRIKGRFISRGGADANSSTPSVSDSGAVSDGGIGGVTGVSKKISNSIRTAHPSTVSLNNLKEDSDGLMDLSSCQLPVSSGVSVASPGRPAPKKYEKSKQRIAKAQKQELLLHSPIAATSKSPLARSSSAVVSPVGSQLNSYTAAMSPPITPTVKGSKAIKKGKVSPVDSKASISTLTNTSNADLASSRRASGAVASSSSHSEAGTPAPLGNTAVQLNSSPIIEEDVQEYDGFGYDFIGMDVMEEDELAGLGMGVGLAGDNVLPLNAATASSTHMKCA